MRKLLAATLALLTVAPAAHAAAAVPDAVLGSVSEPTSIAAYGGSVAWWTRPSDVNWRLRIRDARGSYVPAAIPPLDAPANVTAGPDGDGRTAFVIDSCTGDATGCRVWRYEPSGGGLRRLRLPADTVWAAQWRTSIAFVRGVRVEALGGGTTRCDVPYRLTASGRWRRLDRGRCGRVTGMALRKDALALTVDSRAIRAGDPRFTSQLRLQSLWGGAVLVLASANSGEDTDEYAGPALTGYDVYATHSGTRPVDGFVAARRDGGGVSEIPARTTLAGPLAVDGGRWTYLQGTGDSTSGCKLRDGRCTVVSTADPFGPVARDLLPRLSMDPANLTGRLATDPLTLTGSLTRERVVRGTVLASVPVPGATVSLTHGAFDPDARTRIAWSPTGLTTRTDERGRWSITVDPPIAAKGLYRAAATVPGVGTVWAPSNTVGLVSARISLDAEPAADGTLRLTGTVAPAEPGRTVEIRAAAAGGTPGALVATAPLDAAGSSFSIAIAEPGAARLTAVLPFRAAGYAGRSPSIAVG